MLTIGKLGASRKQLAYYEQQVAGGAEDYYTGRGEAPGRWRGSGIQALGLEAGRDVERGAFMALMHGRHPGDESVLRRMSACSTVAALDLTFSAPKSLSVLFAVADEEVSSAVLAAHEAALDEALAYLEREACFTRRGHAGRMRVRGEGFVAASYRHRMSRAGDPQLHTHVLIANLTAAEGRYTALDAHAIYEHKSAAGAVYRAVLRAVARERLPWVRWREVNRGLFEVDGVSDSVLRHFSQRRVEIEERAAELTTAGAASLSREQMQGIALATRRAKQYGVDGGGWREQARARAAEQGLGEAELVALQARVPSGEAPPNLDALYAHLSGAAGLTEQHNSFARRHALADIAGAFAQGISATELEEVTSAYLDSAGVVPGGQAEEARYTTTGLLASETMIVESTERRTRERAAVIAPVLVERVLAGHEPALNGEQAATVQEVIRSGRGVDAVQALAGTGKTTTLGAIAACYRQARYRVLGAAPTARAARQLREAAGIPAATMHSLLAELERAGGFANRTVLLLDEAGMAPTRLTAELFEHAERAGVKVIAVGDPGQLGPVQAGGWLAAITRHQSQPALRQVLRQRDPAERAALEALRDGDSRSYLRHKRRAMTIHTTEQDAIRALVDQWRGARADHGPTGAVMIARDNRTREQLNRSARQALKAAGALPQAEMVIGGREYARGDRVIARRNDRRLDIDNGTLATVMSIEDNRMLVHIDSGQSRMLELAYVSEHVEHAYALTAHGAQGATVAWTGVIGRPDEFTRQWAYTALSRARERTLIHVIAQPPGRECDRDQYAPTALERTAAQALRALERTMRRDEAEPLALEQLAGASPLRPWLAHGQAARQEELDQLDQLDLQRQLARPTIRAPASRWHQRPPSARGPRLSP